MAEHDIELTIPSKPLMNVDATLVVRSDGKKLGELHISKGTVDWKPAGKKTAAYITWEDFSNMLNKKWARQYAA